MDFQDRLSIEKVRKLSDGRIAAVARFARSGTMQYFGSELGRPDLPTVTVYRPETEVFSEDAMASFAHKAITLDHPAEPVTSASWKKVSVGYTEGRVARDGGFVEIPLMLADASAVQAYESGKAKELSAGYSSDLVWGDGVAPDGTPFQATQTKIRGDHIALVEAGRAGHECRIGDAKKAEVAPASIDELLKARFAELAKQRGGTVAEVLAKMERLEIEEEATNAAKEFVSAQAGKGIAAVFGDVKTAVLLAKAAAGDMRRDALSGGVISAGLDVRDVARAASFGNAPAVTMAARSEVADQASLDAGRVARDAARAAQF